MPWTQWEGVEVGVKQAGLEQHRTGEEPELTGTHRGPEQLLCEEIRQPNTTWGLALGLDLNKNPEKTCFEILAKN